jgi:hypothetical protein
MYDAAAQRLISAVITDHQFAVSCKKKLSSFNFMYYADISLEKLIVHNETPSQESRKLNHNLNREGPEYEA